MAGDRFCARLTRILVDIFCIILSFLLVVIFKLSDISPYQRGFFCDDRSLKFPYKEDTISSFGGVVIGVAVSLAVILGTEIGNFIVTKRDGAVLPVFQFGKVPANSLIFNCYKYIGILLFGAGVCMSFTDVGKYTLGRLRPHFFSVCQPNMTNIDCTNYVTNYTCMGTGSTPYMLLNMRRSFPSGHSSFAIYTSLYTALYLHVRMQWKGSTLLKHLVQAVVMLIGFYVALSRVPDHKHHWSDVFGGSLLGAICAIAVVFMVSDLFKRSLADLPPPQQMKQHQRRTLSSHSDFPEDNGHSLSNPNDVELHGTTKVS